MSTRIIDEQRRQFDGTPSDPRGIKRMCDYAAKMVGAGKASKVNFDAMASEAALIRAYMQRNHPHVPFTIMPSSQAAADVKAQNMLDGLRKA